MDDVFGPDGASGYEHDGDWTKYLNIDGPDVLADFEQLNDQDLLNDPVLLDDPELMSVLSQISLPALASGLQSLRPPDLDNAVAARDQTIQRCQAGNAIDTRHDAGEVGARPKRGRGVYSPRNSLSSTHSAQPSKKKARRLRFSAAQVDILDTWLNCHLEYPYPQQKEKEDLAAATKLTVDQVNSWFARTRQRRLLSAKGRDPWQPEFGDVDHLKPVTVSRQRTQRDESPQQSRLGSASLRSREPGQSSLAVIPASPRPFYLSDQSVASGPSLPNNEAYGDRLAPSALSCGASKVDWWLDTLPSSDSEYEPVSKSEWDNLPPSFQLQLSQDNEERHSLSSSLLPRDVLSVPTWEAFRSRRTSTSISSIDVGTNMFSASITSVGSDLAMTSGQSVSTWATTISSRSLGRRRGRRMGFTHRSAPLHREGSSRKKIQLAKSYWCTFCSTVFPDKYRWRRHEESKHAPQKAWICKPIEVRHGQPAACPLCYFLEDSPAQCMHDMQPCWAKPEYQRTFHRKDNLVQHFEGFHNARAGINSALLAELTEGISSIPYDLTCHFCTAQNPTWDDRVDHIAKHFEGGITMDSWKPPPSVNAESAALNQIKPYLPQLSRMWKARGGPQAAERQSKKESNFCVFLPGDANVPRIVVEDYSKVLRAPDSAPPAYPEFSCHTEEGISTLRDQHESDILTLNKAEDVRSYKKIKFKHVTPKKSLKSKIGKLLTKFTLSPTAGT
ncbi:hypothetical protein H2200_005028 [Cladophialophora chaetospira]|uniref:Homeobox and C2H2 transcription factor n=1 Tax=Cladophialophora chaetospira TaxID=386627 RepID=A0AA38XBD8_9EURO|nr:hypothetical protein H2200_005028 [Cladophialophora chaetospira]